MDPEDAEAEFKAVDRWYGIVDGAHRLMALIELMQDYPAKWGSFAWQVMVTKRLEDYKLRFFA